MQGSVELELQQPRREKTLGARLELQGRGVGAGGRKRGGFFLLALPAFLSSVISFIFTQNKGGMRSPGLLF